MRRRSKKGTERNKEYAILRNSYLVAYPICQCCQRQKATEIHHKAGRDGINLFRHFLAVCHKCHCKIEREPRWAKNNSYSITRLNEEE